MKVFMLKDVEKVGASEEIVSVSDGYAVNFLIPSKLALEVTATNEAGLRKRVRTFERRQEVVASKTSLLAERIKSLKPVLKAKIHDGEKLYATVSAHDIVELLGKEGVSIAKNQVVFEKTIKTKGLHPVTVKLSNNLQPSFMLKVVAE